MAHEGQSRSLGIQICMNTELEQASRPQRLPEWSCMPLWSGQKQKCVFYREASPAPGEGGAILCKLGFLSHLSTLKTFQKGFFSGTGVVISPRAFSPVTSLYRHPTRSQCVPSTEASCCRPTATRTCTTGCTPSTHSWLGPFGKGWAERWYPFLCRGCSCNKSAGRLSECRS